MKVALVYDRVNKWGGAERVLLALHEIFPDAPLFTAVYSPEKAKWAKVFPEVITTFLQKIPFVQDKHEMLGTFTPIAFETLDFSNFDLVISVTSEAAKGIITKPSTLHVCYCLTPTRYLWSGYDVYFRNKLLRFIAQPAILYLRTWDKVAAFRPDKMIAISTAVKRRIKKYYNRDSKVIFPPVEIEKFKPEKNKDLEKEDFFLVVARLVPYKRTDLVIEAFNKLGLRLVIVGSGSEKKHLERMAKDNIFFTGELTDKELAMYYQKARGLIFPQEEDFGIVALEAQSAGTPVVAYKKGGALDTVIEGKTGVFFNKQEVSSLISAIRKLEKMKLDKRKIIENAERFSKERFKREIKEAISQWMR